MNEYVKKYEEKLIEYNRLKQSIEEYETRLETGGDDALYIRDALQISRIDAKYFFEFADADIKEAAKNDDLEAVQFLFDRVGKNARYEAFHSATKSNVIEVVKFFLEKGLNPFLKIADQAGLYKVSAYQIAKLAKHSELISLFENSRS